MRVGIVNFNRYGEPTELVKVLQNMGIVVLIINHSEHWFSIIRKSDVKHWFFTGSSYDVLSPISPQIGTKLYDLKDKSLFFICYSMESALHGLGYKLHKKPRTNQRLFDITDTRGDTKMRVWKSHDTFVSVSESKLRPLAKYGDELMTFKYKNALMTQWHPERTPDGVRTITEWLQN